MPLDAEADKLALVEQAAQLALTTPGAAADAGFIRHLYAHVPPADLLERSAEGLFAAAESLRGFMEKRRPGRAQLRILDPGAEGLDWAGGRAIVQIVNDDMPFLVDSVSSALNGAGAPAHVLIHPVYAVSRDAEGTLLAPPAPLPGDVRESVMLIELSGRLDAAKREALCAELKSVLAAVRAAVVDWRPMVKRVKQLGDDLGAATLPVPPAEAEEVAEFLSWLTEDNFTFLGYREYNFGADGLEVIPGQGKGLLRDDSFLVFEGLRNFNALSPDVQAFLRSPQLMLISKSNRRSPVHRPVPLDTITLKTFDEDGQVTGQRLIVGLFTSASYAKSPRTIPVLRRKVQRCTDRAGFAPSSHDAKMFHHVLEFYPRDELFQIGEDELFQTVRGILNLQERQRIALFIRRDPFERFVSCLVFVPRDRYSADVRGRMTVILERAFNGKLTDPPVIHLDESVLARLHFLVSTTPAQVPAIDIAALEAELVKAGRVWSDGLREALYEAHDEAAAEDLFARYAQAFPAGYQERTEEGQAVADIARVELVAKGAPIALALYRPPEASARELRLKTVHDASPIALSDVLPMLEDLGLRVISEMPVAVQPLGAARPVWIQEFQMEPRRADTVVDPAADGPRFEQALAAVWGGAVENDGFNRLVLAAGLTVREVVILRAYAKLMRQAGSSFSQDYMEDTLAAHAGIASLLVRLFETQFDPRRPDAGREASAAGIAGAIEDKLDQVTNLDEDRILRSFLLLISKSLRTNYFQTGADGAPKGYLSVKLKSQEIELLPLPRPLYEIFVYAPWMEGCHLRGGKVARGGIRWSDRREDFRTEILGLMKAQQVKNSVIVPMGSKGGFVVKRPPTSGGREALMAEVVHCYKTLMRGLLDLTDTIEGDGLVKPAALVRRDGDDPYLVVAADKGTATFSDIANSVSLEYGFWLGDAFASGGSVGYDHKVMGITARGAWEAVKRHFRELGTDIQTTDFTCVGVGDMAGDVFGNGMLLSRHIRLVAAFNHMHIFLDPNPDSAVSWVERKRLFDLPRSSWADYDASLISAGGGVFERAAKSIPLSPEVRALFGIEEESLSPAQLIQRLLKHPSDLLWFGGIGTYLKASTESHADAGDRANDALRVDANQLRAKVIGEGANLAMTQRARIEFALRGGRLNTDAIDNSAGVDTSDHEVNIKIAVSNMLQSGKVAPADRNAYLAAMTDEVGLLVLEDNYLQTQALTLAEAEAAQILDQHIRLMKTLERAGKLDRGIEFLPDDETLAQRTAAKRGLTRPELAVLLAYAKNAVYAELLTTDLPDEPVLEQELLAYFPRQMVRTSQRDLETHRLRREIIATHITNAMLNRMGPSFIVEMQTKTGRSVADITRAYRITRDIFDLPAIWRAIEALDNQIAASAQTQLHLVVKGVAERAARWLLQSGLALDIPARIAQFAPGLAQLSAVLADLLPPGERHNFANRRAPFDQAAVPVDLANKVVGLANLAAGLDIIRLDEQVSGIEVLDLGRLYYQVGERLGLDSLRGFARTMPAVTGWQRLAVGAVLDDFYLLQRDITQRALAEGGGDILVRFERWCAARAEAVNRIREMVAEFAGISPDLAMLTVAARQLRSLASA